MAKAHGKRELCARRDAEHRGSVGWQLDREAQMSPSAQVIDEELLVCREPFEIGGEWGCALPRRVLMERERLIVQAACTDHHRGRHVGSPRERLPGAPEWQQIETWCQEHAPETAATIRAPADNEVFNWAHSCTAPMTWPDPLWAFYAWCDGAERAPAGCLWPGFRPLSLVELVETWRELMRAWFPDTSPSPSTPEDDLGRAFGQQAIDLHVVDPELDRLYRAPAGTAIHTFIPALLPVAEDQSGSLLVCDRRPKPRSHRGAIAVFDRVDGYVQDAPWRNLTALASATATALRTGNVVAGTRSHPVALGGRLTWTTAAPDPLDQPDGAAIDLVDGAGWSPLPGTDIEVIAAPGADGTRLRYRRARP